ncbi:MAG TPA: PH domain-containing protein [Gemmatimonadota bacterium]|nr:PH domain-containing protein [Gemmatimonadota bacterium]
MNESDSLNPLHPNIVIAWRLGGLITAAVWTAIAGSIEFLAVIPGIGPILAPGAVTGSVAVLAFTLALLWPGLRYRYWRWRVEPDRVLMQKGVIWRSRSLIPRVRIQHVDTRSSPLQRWLGLTSLVIYTAGTRGADATIPGLTADEAVSLRDELARLEELDERA